MSPGRTHTEYWWAVTDSNRRHPACKAGQATRQQATSAAKFSPRITVFAAVYWRLSDTVADIARHCQTCYWRYPRITPGGCHGKSIDGEERGVGGAG
jgi:hypothetical protein